MSELGFFVALGQTDQRLAESVGSARVAECLRFGGHNKQLDTRRSNLAVQVDGAIGELAFCRAFGLMFDDAAGTPGRKWANKPDTIDIEGRRYDVKATRLAHGRLMLYRPKPGENDYANVDVFVLARLHRYPPAVALVGWSFKADLMREANLEDVGYGPTYFINVHDPAFHPFR